MAARAAFAAIRGITRHVEAGAVAVEEPVVALEVATARMAGGPRPRGRRTARVAGAAVFRIAGDHDAFARADGFALVARDSAAIRASAGGSHTAVRLAIADEPRDAAAVSIASAPLEIGREVARAGGHEARK